MTLRLEKGFPLTPLEVDNNFRILRDFDNGLESLFYVSFNTDGTLKDGAVWREAVLVDRVVTQRKLSFTSSFFAVAGGAANAFTAGFTPALSGGYVQGMVFFIKANHSITGAATLNIDGQGAVSIRKTYNANLVSGDIVNNQVFTVVYESSGPYFQLVNTLPFLAGITGLGSSLQLLRTNTGATAAEWFTPYFTGAAQAIVGANITWAHGFSKRPDIIQVNLRCIDAAGDDGYAQFDEVDVAEAQGNGDNAWASIMSNATQIVLVNDPATVIQLRNKASGALTNLDKTKWNVVAYAHLLT